MTKKYTVILPRLDDTGPTNLALDLANEAISAGWKVRILYLSRKNKSPQASAIFETAQFSVSDIFSLKGIIHSHGITADLCASLIPRTADRRIVSTLHGQYPDHLYFEHGNFVSKVAWLIWRRALSRFDALFCISNTMKSFYTGQLPDTRLHVAFNITSGSKGEQEVFPAGLQSWIKHQRNIGKTILIFAGSLSDRKNISALITHIRKSDKLSLIVCGNGPLLSELSAKPNSAENIECNVFFAGHVSNLSDYLRLSDIFVLPSFAEGLPLVVLEALKEGCPSVLSDIAVHRELCLMGAGEVFDHVTFADFDDVVSRTLDTRNIDFDKARRRLWESCFSPKNGFNRYEEIFLST